MTWNVLATVMPVSPTVEWALQVSREVPAATKPDPGAPTAQPHKMAGRPCGPYQALPYACTTTPPQAGTGPLRLSLRRQRNEPWDTGSQRATGASSRRCAAGCLVAAIALGPSTSVQVCWPFFGERGGGQPARTPGPSRRRGVPAKQPCGVGSCAACCSSSHTSPLFCPRVAEGRCRCVARSSVRCRAISLLATRGCFCAGPAMPGVPAGQRPASARLTLCAVLCAPTPCVGPVRGRQRFHLGRCSRLRSRAAPCLLRAAAASRGTSSMLTQDIAVDTEYRVAAHR